MLPSDLHLRWLCNADYRVFTKMRFLYFACQFFAFCVADYNKGLWRHHLNRNECIPHVGIKTYFMSGEAAAPDPPLGTHYYGGPSAKDIGVVANPRLWFKEFRTGMSDELFETIKAVEPD